MAWAFPARPDEQGDNDVTDSVTLSPAREDTSFQETPSQATQGSTLAPQSSPAHLCLLSGVGFGPICSLNGLLTRLYGPLIHNRVQAHLFPSTVLSASRQTFSRAPIPRVSTEVRKLVSVKVTAFPSFLSHPSSSLFCFSLGNSLLLCSLNIVPGCKLRGWKTERVPASLRL